MGSLLNALHKILKIVRCNYHPNFTGRKTSTEWLSNLSKITQLVNGRARIQTPAI